MGLFWSAGLLAFPIAGALIPLGKVLFYWCMCFLSIVAVIILCFLANPEPVDPDEEDKDDEKTPTDG